MRHSVLAILLLAGCGESVAHEPFELDDAAFDLNATPILVSVYLAPELDAQLRAEGRHVAKLRTSFNITGSEVFAPTVEIDPTKELAEDLAPGDVGTKGSTQGTHVTRLLGLPTGRLNVRVAAFDAGGQQVGVGCFPASNTGGQAANNSIRPRNVAGESAAAMAFDVQVAVREDCPVVR